MFGYVKPFKPDLMIKEYEFYKSAYCGLCKALGKNYGVVARLALSYDATFLAMFLLSLNHDTCPDLHKESCKANPFKKCLFCYEKEEIMAFAGAVSVVMMYYKLEDNILDSGFFKRMGAYILKGVGYYSYKRAKRAYPQVDAIVRRCLDRQNSVEKTDSVTLDKAAQPTADMIKELLLLRAAEEDETLRQIFSQFGYYMGRWIYLADAADDMENDKKKGNFNPFFLGEAGQGYLSSDMNTPTREFREACNSTLNHTVSKALAAFNLLDCRNFGSILRNTMEKGLGNVQKEICSFAAKEHREERLNENK